MFHKKQLSFQVESFPLTFCSKQAAVNMGCLILFLFLSLMPSCGYRMVGTTPIPFESISIQPVINKTYEPKLEDFLHRALSETFIEQGIQVTAAGGEYTLQSVIVDFTTTAEAQFRVETLREFDNTTVAEQRVEMYVDFTLLKGEKVIQFGQVNSAYRFSFNAIGSVQSTVLRREIDIIRLSEEISLELLTKIMFTELK